MAAAALLAIFAGRRAVRVLLDEIAADRAAIFLIGCCLAFYIASTIFIEGKAWQQTGDSCVAPLTAYRPGKLWLLAIPAATLFLPYSRRIAGFVMSGLLLLFIVGIAEAALAHNVLTSRDVAVAYNLGSEIRFNNATNADKYLRGDVLRPENSGTWVGREAVIVVPLEKPVPAGLRVTLDMLGLEGQRSTIMVNGYPQATFNPAWSKSPVIQISSTQLGPSGVLRIRLNSERVSGPANGDIRQRSLFLQSLRLDRT